MAMHYSIAKYNRGNYSTNCITINPTKSNVLQELCVKIHYIFHPERHVDSQSANQGVSKDWKWYLTVGSNLPKINIDFLM